MSINIQPNADFIREFLLNLLKIPSPTGNTEMAIAFVEAACQRFNLETYRTVKGSLVAKLPTGAVNNSPVPRTVMSHVDTLGAMVKEIKNNGRLRLTMLGGYAPLSILGEYCQVETASGQLFTGTVLLSRQSVHIHGRNEIHQLADSLDNLEVRLDVRTDSYLETEELGIAVGDFVAWDSRAQYTKAGFIKSRHLDDKAGVAAMLGAVEMMGRAQLTATHPTYLYFTTYEEVGHGGAAGIPVDTQELLAVDMGVIGEGQTSDEFSVSICVKDARGPYDLTMRRRLVNLAKAANIPINLDVYVNYSSDGSAALAAGADVRVALIGPGVDASHAYERTHLDAVLHSSRLITAYLTKP